MTDPTRETAVSAAEADPGAIDLAQIKFLLHRHRILSGSDPDRLIAAVEALRERVVELEQLAFDGQSGKSWRAIVLENDFRAGEIDRIASEYLQRAEASEAQVVELAGALKKIRAGPGTSEMHEICNTALAALPADALERARAKDEATSALRSYYFAEMMADTSPTAGRAALLGEIGLFLGKLDALDREDGT